MTDVRVAVERIANDRFAIMLVDVSAGRVAKGPDGGERHQGYTAAELHRVLAERYGMPEAEIADRIKAAEDRGIGSGAS